MFTQGQIRQISWSRSYLWDIRFPSAPAPFKDWFPATDVSVEMGVLVSKEFTFFSTDCSIPIGTKEKSLNITFIDDAVHTLIDWVTFWMNTIVSPVSIKGNNFLIDSGVLTLEQAVKEINIIRLNSKRNPINVGNEEYIDKYKVYPTGTIKFIGDSDSKVNSYQVNFVIAEIIGIQPYITNMFSKGAQRGG
jgi:hypothetical protein